MAHLPKRPRVIAHRGARREAPENTLPAFRRAIELGAGGVEFDVQLTSDDRAIVFHDDELHRVTGVHGRLCRTPFETIRSLDAAVHFEDKAFAGTPIPTLGEVLELLAPHEMLVNVEIKPHPGRIAAAVKIIGGLLSDARMRGRLLVSSFSMRVVHELRRRFPKLPRAYVFESPFPFFPVALFARYERLAALHPYVHALWPSVIKRIRRGGYEVNAWTVNSTAEIDHCVTLSLDGIMTDDVVQTMAHLDTLASHKEPV